MANITLCLKNWLGPYWLPIDWINWNHWTGCERTLWSYLQHSHVHTLELRDWADDRSSGTTILNFPSFRNSASNHLRTPSSVARTGKLFSCARVLVCIYARLFYVYFLWKEFILIQRVRIYFISPWLLL